MHSSVKRRLEFMKFYLFQAQRSGTENEAKPLFTVDIDHKVSSTNASVILVRSIKAEP